MGCLDRLFMPDFSYHVESRLDSLAQLHEVLSNAHWTATSLLISLQMFDAYSKPITADWIN